MNEEIIIEKLTADAMKSVTGGADIRTIATAWEVRTTDPVDASGGNG